jgi:hypothetical protein
LHFTIATDEPDRLFVRTPHGMIHHLLAEDTGERSGLANRSTARGGPQD